MSRNPTAYDNEPADELSKIRPILCFTVFTGRSPLSLNEHELQALNDAEIKLKKLFNRQQAALVRGFLEQKQEAEIFNTNPKTKIMRWYSHMGEAIPASLLEDWLKEHES